MRFVCDDCTAQRHEECRGGTWCDCQHKARRFRALFRPVGIICASVVVAVGVCTHSSATSIGRALPTSHTRWMPVTPALVALDPESLGGYDERCIARLEDGRVTMAACPDGRVGWFDIRAAGWQRFVASFALDVLQGAGR